MNRAENINKALEHVEKLCKVEKINRENAM